MHINSLSQIIIPNTWSSLKYKSSRHGLLHFISCERVLRNECNASPTLQTFWHSQGYLKVPNNHATVLEREREKERKGNLVHISFIPLIYAPIFSAVFINEPTKVTIRRVLMLVMSSGTSQIVAPILRAIEMASLALAYISSSVRPGATRS